MGPPADEPMNEQEMRKMILPDLRVACRERGLSPAGGVGQLVDRLVEAIQAGTVAPIRKASACLLSVWWEGGDRGGTGEGPFPLLLRCCPGW